MLTPPATPPKERKVRAKRKLNDRNTHQDDWENYKDMIIVKKPPTTRFSGKSIAQLVADLTKSSPSSKRSSPNQRGREANARREAVKRAGTLSTPSSTPYLPMESSAVVAKSRKTTGVPVSYLHHQCSSACLLVDNTDSEYATPAIMIGCDNVECERQWFHLECVGLESVPEGEWFCVACRTHSEQSLNGEANDETLSVLPAGRDKAFVAVGSPSSTVLKQAEKESAGSTSDTKSYTLTSLGHPRLTAAPPPASITTSTPPFTITKLGHARLISSASAASRKPAKTNNTRRIGEEIRNNDSDEHRVNSSETHTSQAHSGPTTEAEEDENRPSKKTYQDLYTHLRSLFIPSSVRGIEEAEVMRRRDEAVGRKDKDHLQLPQSEGDMVMYHDSAGMDEDAM